MKFTDIFIRRPVLAASISLLIVILGLQALAKLNVRQYPEMTTTVLNVSTIYPGADAGLMQSFVTSTLEESIAQANNIDYISSSSSPGSSNITIKMKLNTNPNEALADILSKVNAVRSKLPTGIEDPVITSSSGGTGIIYFQFYSNKLNASQVTDYIERVVKPQFFTIPGIAQVDIFGAADYAMRIWFDPEKLAAQHLSISQVMQVLTANNLQAAAGSENGYYVTYRNKINTTTNTIDELKNLIISDKDNHIVRLKDIATVELNKASDKVRATANGKNAVILSIEANSTANPIDVVKAIMPLYAQIKAALPNGINTSVLYDSTLSIDSSIHEVIKTIVEATVIVLIVILLFIGSLRAILVPIVTIPLSLIGVIFLLQVCGFTINLMTLLAMILAIGLVVDDAIVVLENVDRHVKGGETAFRAAIIGTREIAVPVISMTLTLVAVYAPIALTGGITGSLFKEFALTLAGTVFISGIIALTLSPMMCSKLMKENDNPSKFEQIVDSTLNKVTQSYLKILNLIMYYRGWALAFAVGIFITLPFLLRSLPTEMVPQEDKGAFFVMGNAPAMANIDYVQDSMKQFENLVKKNPNVTSQMVISGNPTSNQAISIVMLKDWADRKETQAQISAKINRQAKAIPEMSISAFGFPEINTGEMGPPIGFVISTNDSYRKLAPIAQEFLEKMRKSGKFIFSSLDLKFDTAEVDLQIDRNKARTYGISMQQIANALGSYLAAPTITRVNIDGRAYKVIAQVKRADRLSPESLKKFFVKTASGESIPLSSIITMHVESSPASLPRFNQLNAATISAVQMPGVSMGDAVKWLETTAKQDLPKSYQINFRGEARQYVQEGSTLALTFVLAILIIYLVLAIQFESFRDPLVILVSVPLAVSGALLVLNICSFPRDPVAGATLNIYSEVGLITLIGLITKHGILMCEVAKEEQLQGKSRIEAIMIAAKIRLRPILMTVAAMIAGLIPLLYASGAGAVSRFSIGIVIVSGLGIGTFFTLFILPVIYTYLATRHKPLKVFDENKPSALAEKSKTTE
ncbi:efflux RND transporter permease subunit [Actinobacillus delphinicola]|uniref:Acriflavin resistance protein n=1 Tax=Actinobacillus delphinicola TaxID=51161 RepID=A0A448TU11_9PAST|nr:efflux RND transporter permease subunit [Actinobacillus delphinicola]VEJ09426.1 acriflavin resistance protein [Actinobacillus delphinicola]